MPFLVAGCVVLALLLIALNGATRANPAVAARVLRAAFAVGMGGFALWRLATAHRPPFNWRWDGGPRPGATSKVSAASLDMELDHATGDMRGLVRAGAYAGRALDELSLAQCVALHGEFERLDPQAARLLEPYLDRRFALWRAAEEPDGDARREGARGEVKPMGMTKEEACEILGLEQGASGQSVTQAHRRLMKKMHPDHGGTTDDAARLNQARDILLRRHR